MKTNTGNSSSNLGFLAWYQVSSGFEDSQQNSIINLTKKICNYIEDEINENGGIAGQNIKVHFLEIPENTNQAKEIFENYLKANSDIMFICQAPNFYEKDPKKNMIYQELLDKFQDQPYIVFDSLEMFSENYSKNFFSTSKKSVSRNNILQIIELLFTPNNIFNFSFNKTKFSKDGLNCKIIDIDINKTKNQDDDELEILDELNQSSDKDVICLGHTRDIKKKISFISKYIKSDTKAKLVLSKFDVRMINKLPVEILRNFSKKDIYFFDDENYHIYLKLKQIFYSLDIKTTNLERKYVNWLFGVELEIPYLVEYLFKKNNINSTFGVPGSASIDKKQFLNECKKLLNSLSDKNDIFLGKSCNFLFRDNVNILKGNSLLKVKYDEENQEAQFFLHDKQFRNIENYKKICYVNYTNIDIVKVNNISLDRNDFSIEFYFDITSRHDDPIENIKFNNLNPNNYYYEAKLTNVTPLPNSELSTYRYLIRANLSFDGSVSRYPFDEQIIFIAFSVVNEQKYGIIQPFQDNEIDDDVEIDGWKMVQKRFGILRTKNRINLGPDRSPKIEIEEELRMGWRIRRTSTMTAIKLGVPLAFLTLLVYYTLFIPLDNIDTSIEILATSFLSGIALYFSTDNPQPLSMSIVDYIFAIYYVVVALITLGVTVFAFIPSYFEMYMLVAKFFIPLAIFISILIIKYKISSQKKFLKMVPKKLFD
jgi:hypothetical protein